jgi:HSP20 family molecular chaperone IbpA
MKSLLKPSLIVLSLVTIAGAALATDCSSAKEERAGTQASATLPYPAMGRIVYINPFADMMRMQAEMNREFNALNSLHAMWMPVMLAPPVAMPMQASSLQRTKDGYQLRVNVPGFNPEDVHVRLDGNMLTISAQESSSSNQKSGNGPVQSMRSRSFVQRMPLPVQIGTAGFKQTVQNGVLTITIPSQNAAPGHV